MKSHASSALSEHPQNTVASATFSEEPARLGIKEPGETSASAAKQERLLVFDCHEAWVYQLGALDCGLDIIVGLPGRHVQGWDERMRPVPPRAQLVRLQDVPQDGSPYRCIVASNLTDLLDAKSFAGPRILVLHETLDGAILEQKATVSADQLRRIVQKFIRLTGTHVVAVSKLKRRSWGLDGDVVPAAVAPSDYLPWSGDIPRGLRIANHIERRPRVLMWDLHQKAFSGLPVTLVGHNPGLERVTPAADWSALKQTLSSHRFYIHTADPHLEDGYNMASLEAMAAGLPVVGNRHPTSPIEHGVTGFLSDDPDELRSYAELLLQDRDLALRMGQAARALVLEKFSYARFQEGFTQAVETARRQWKRLSS